MVIEPEDDRPGVDVRIERRELSRLVWESVSALDDKYREILILRDYNDLSYAEIASTLHIPLGTVMSRLHKARRLLADELAARGYSHPSRDEHTPPEGRSRVIPFDKRGKGE